MTKAVVTFNNGPFCLYSPLKLGKALRNSTVSVMIKPSSKKVGATMPRYQNQHLFQLREIGLGLTFVGGFIDAYTFVQRGGVLAAGQTGNLVFLSVDIAQRNLPGALTKVCTVAFFIIGVALVGLLNHHLGAHSHFWRLPIMIAEFIVCLIVGYLPKTTNNIFIVPLLALVMSMQTTAFSQIAGHGYANVFTTGNLKKATIALTDFLITRNRQSLTTALVYWELVLCFAGGAIVSALLQIWWTTHTIWLANGLLILIGGYYALGLAKRED